MTFGYESTVDEEYAVSIPDVVRDVVALEPGDRLRWTVDDDGRIAVEIGRQREGGRILTRVDRRG